MIVVTFCRLQEALSLRSRSTATLTAVSQAKELYARRTAYEIVARASHDKHRVAVEKALQSAVHPLMPCSEPVLLEAFHKHAASIAGPLYQVTLRQVDEVKTSLLEVKFGLSVLVPSIWWDSR